ncbi:Helix-turn-helix domain-containing protein [Oscillospiraceae bacterium]|nr:Helix-turn-helix domain-containing protein [Oscillospiraceae bacterium]
MSLSIAEALRKLRMERGLSQQQLADMLFVDRSSIASWESGRRSPDASFISKLADTLKVDVEKLLNHIEEEHSSKTCAILIDDEKIILRGGLPVLERVMPDCVVRGFSNPLEAVDYARSTRVDLAFVDIEMGKYSGLDICRELITINSKINVIYLTSHADYAFDAWATGACGFILKPLTLDGIRKQFPFLRYPIKGLARL